MAHPTDDELEAMAARLDNARLTMTNDDTSQQGTDKRARFINRLDAMDEAAAMLRACKGRVRVKPLEWKWYRDPKDTSEARTQIGTWTVWEINGYGYCYGPGDTSGRQCEGALEAAKAAAQADYAARILAALEPAPDHAELEAENARLRDELLKYAEWMMRCPDVSDDLRAALRALEQG